ncbi:MAG TPA: 50S ribosomal protein L9 [Tepidisphaeraceae bacterium]|nr:50S ribosomal protein L9 [Tepidisphaeraceae bacterium]
MANNVKLLLKESIKHVGRVGDIVEVSAGYARNYLVPKDLAVEPTPGNVKKVEERKKEIERIEKARRGEQEKLIAKLKGVEVHLERRANEQGHLFGSVGATDIAKQLQSQGFDVNPDDINLPGKLDRVADYAVVVSFADDLEAELKVWVHADAESKAAMDAFAKSKQAETPAAE